MAIWRAVAHQLREPAGPAGWLAGYAMRFVNARPNALAVAALDVQAADAILELGCGPGHAIRLMVPRAPSGIIHAVDQSATMLAQARARNHRAVRSGRVRLYRTQFEALPFPDQSIDKILAVNVAYFWHDADAVLHELRRVLRPGGLMALYVTQASCMCRWKFADPETHRLYDRDGLVALLRRGNFATASIDVKRVQLPMGVTGLIAVVGRHPPS
jgi:ubiquinone/menaquinone biosynthesis C-methylase UbiE